MEQSSPVVSTSKIDRMSRLFLEHMMPDNIINDSSTPFLYKKY